MRKNAFVAKALFWVLASLTAAPLLHAQTVVISEFRVRGPAGGNDEFIELYNPTAAEVNVGGWKIKGSNSSGFVGVRVTIAANTKIPAGGHFLATNSASGGYSGSVSGNQTYATGITDDGGIALTLANDTIVDQVGMSTGSAFGEGTRLSSLGSSNQNRSWERKPGGSLGSGQDTNNNVADFQLISPSDPQNLSSGGVTPVATREIFDIQGSGSASPYAGDTVQTLDNVVTAVGVEGFFIQTPDYRADASTSTSNGLYVFTGAAPAVQVGDQVDVKGKIVEFFDFTELTAPITFTVDAHNTPLPAYFVLTPGYSNFEPLEGMLVRVVNGTATDGTDRFNETTVVADATRPFRTPGIAGANHPEIFDVDPTGLGGVAAAQQIIGGARVDLAEGPLAFDFGDYSIWSTSLAFTNPAYPRGARARNAGELIVGGQNMFRLFDTVDDPAISDDVPTPAVYAARLAKISDHIRNNMGAPDVLAVSETENMTALQDLADKLNLDQAGLNYSAYLVEGHDIGGIDVGFLVRDTVTVDSVEQLGADDTWSDPQAPAGQISYLNDRPPLLLRGAYVGNGTPFPIAVIAVHQRSLIGVDTPRTQEKRQLQANALAGYINEIQTAEPGARIVVTGDFNAFEFDDGYVDVMGIITSGANLTNQVLTVPAADRFSYVEQGVAQVLDHSLTSQGLASFVRGANFVHANADAPAASNPASDHDGIALFVMSDHDGDGLADDNDACPTGDARPTVILGGCDSGAPNIAFAGGCTLADRLNDMHAAAKNHGQFVSEAGKLLNSLMKSGQLTGAQKGAIESCAGQWN